MRGKYPLNLFVCKSDERSILGAVILVARVISCCLFACQQKEEEVRLTFEDGIAQALQTGKSCWCGMPGKMESIRRIISKRLKRNLNRIHCSGKIIFLYIM